MDDNELPYLIALSYIQGIGSVRAKLLVEYLKKPSLIWAAEDKIIKEILGPNLGESFLTQRSKLDPDNLYQNIIKDNISIITYWNEDYPKLLKEIADPPFLLYYKGTILPEDKNSLAIVGTRKVSAYGKQVTEFFTTELAKLGFTIISGLARGVDSLAHKFTLESQGRTLAVLGSGLNKIYPPENKLLAERIIESGAVISEYPPDFPPNPGTFPARNRIISGLSLGVIITEAAYDSGSLITASSALEQNREVFAVPGPIFSKLSGGTAKLIKEGAKLATSVPDVLEELGMEKDSIINNQTYIPQNELEEKILQILEEEKHIDELVNLLQSDSAEVGSCLSILELQGAVRNLGSGYFRKK